MSTSLNERLLKDEPPKDKGMGVYISMILIGVGCLLPWNAVITAVAYYSAVYSFVAANIETYISAAFTTPCVFVLVIMLKYGSKISPTKRIVGTLVFCAVGLALLPVVPLILSCDSCMYNQQSNRTASMDDVTGECWASLAVTLVLCFAVGLSANALQFSSYGLGGIFPAVYTQALMAGNGVAGVIILVLSIGTTAIYQCNPANTSGDSNYTVCEVELGNQRSSAYIYFALGGGILIVCLILCLWISRQPFAKYYMNLADMSHMKEEAEEAKEREHLANVVEDGVADPDEIEIDDGEPKNFCQLGKRIWGSALQVYLCFTITILLFPAVSAIIPYDNLVLWLNEIFGSCGSDMTTWWTFLLFLLFNLFDLAGRLTAKYECCRAWFTIPRLWIITLIRLGFIPLFLFAAGTAENGSLARVPTFNSYVVMLIMALFAFTNGYNGSLCMMLAPGTVKPKLQEKVGFIMSFCLQLGILSGSYGAIPVTHLLARS